MSGKDAARPPASRRAARSALGLAAAALALTACGPLGDARTASPGPSGDGVLRIGVLLDSTGPAAFLGEAQRAAVALAVQQANAAGGHGGTPVELLPAESTEDTAAGARRLVDAGADVVVGPTDSSRAPAAIDVLAAAKVPLISPANTSGTLSTYPSGGFYFRTAAPETALGAALVEQARAAGAKSVAILHQDGQHGQAVAEGASAAAKAAGLAESGSAEFTGQGITAAAGAAKGADAVIVVARQGGQAILAQLLEAGVPGGRLILSDGLLAKHGSAVAGGALEGTQAVVPGVFPGSDFQTAVLSQDADLADMAFAAEAYDAAALAVLAAGDAKDDGGPSIAARLTAVSGGQGGGGSREQCQGLPACLTAQSDGKAVDYQGESGPIAFDSHGDVTTARFMVLRYGADNLPQHAGEVTVAR